MSYTTTAEIREYLGISGSGDDTLIAQLAETAQTAINRYTRRQFEATSDTTRYFDARGPHLDGRVLYLDTDLCSVTTVVNGDGTTIASTYYTTLPRNVASDVNAPGYAPYYAIRLLSDATDYYWTYDDEWMDAISITGRWGYSTSPPYDIRHAAMRLAAFYYRQKDAQMFDTTVIEAGVVARPMAMPPDVRALLEKYIPMVT